MSTNNTEEAQVAKDKPFINEEELLARIPLCRRTIWNLRQSGKIPSIKSGSRTIYHWPSVEAAFLRLQKGN